MINKFDFVTKLKSNYYKITAKMFREKLVRHKITLHPNEG